MLAERTNVPPVVVAGSLAWDLIGEASGSFPQATELDLAAEQFSLSMKLDTLRRCFGGCAMNIAYGLAQLGVPVFPLVRAGRDYQPDYAAHVASSGIHDHGIEVVAQWPTSATCILLNDRDGNQVTAFHGVDTLDGTLQTSVVHLCDREKPAHVILAPDGASAMLHHARALRAQSISFLADPGQGVLDFTADETAQLLDCATELIVNRYEWHSITSMLAIDPGRVPENLTRVLVTNGGEAIQILDHGQDIEVLPPPLIGKPLDPTGAGDAFRSGWTYGLLLGHSALTSARLGCLMSRYALRTRGGQGYSTSAKILAQDYARYYDSEL